MAFFPSRRHGLLLAIPCLLALLVSIPLTESVQEAQAVNGPCGPLALLETICNGEPELTEDQLTAICREYVEFIMPNASRREKSRAFQECYRTLGVGDNIVIDEFCDYVETAYECICQGEGCFPDPEPTETETESPMSSQAAAYSDYDEEIEFFGNYREGSGEDAIEEIEQELNRVEDELFQRQVEILINGQ